MRFPSTRLRFGSRLSAMVTDIFLLFAVIGFIALAARVGSGMFVAFNPAISSGPKIDLDPMQLPYYVARSTLRMFIALPISVIFALGYGYVAAHSKYAERVLVPALDILQSVPVLGFLSITVTAFIGAFKGSLLGLEAASIFAIFTGQAWNLAFAFYQALRNIPLELREACRINQLRRWYTFKRLELPSSMIPLVWNAMISFGGGWFFVSASEAISVLGHNYVLPGIGSYVTLAVETQNYSAIGYASVAMIVMILIVDQLLWRPIIAWAEKFKFEQTEASTVPKSWFLTLLNSSQFPKAFLKAKDDFRDFMRRQNFRSAFKPVIGFPKRLSADDRSDKVFNGVMLVTLLVAAYFGASFILTEVSFQEVATTLFSGLLTFLRVLVLLLFSSLVWIPIGVWIGFNPKFARIAQPIVLLLASFPANFLFPFVTIILIRQNWSIDTGSIFLMALGAQWYVLFNVIGGAQAVPSELKEMATSFHVKGWQLWSAVIVPAIFPSWVTGAITAVGGAWNASIIAEVVSWGPTTLSAHGLGSYIAKATHEGDWPRITLGVSMMCVFVVVLNRLFWRRLYDLATQRFSL